MVSRKRLLAFFCDLSLCFWWTQWRIQTWLFERGSKTWPQNTLAHLVSSSIHRWYHSMTSIIRNRGNILSIISIAKESEQQMKNKTNGRPFFPNKDITKKSQHWFVCPHFFLLQVKKGCGTILLKKGSVVVWLNTARNWPSPDPLL